MKKNYLLMTAAFALAGAANVSAQSVEQPRMSVLKAANGMQLWGNIVNESNAKLNGMYRFSPTDPTPVGMTTSSRFIANAGSVYYDTHFRFIYADYTYAAQGQVSANIFDYTVDDNETWASTGKHKSVNANLIAVETAFDRKTGKVYGEFYTDKSLSTMEFGVADYNALTRTTIGTATHKYVAIGLTSDLVMYGVATDGNLYSISTTDGTETLVGPTGLTLQTTEGTVYAQSGEIDQRDNTFYWAAATADGKLGLYTVDLTTGAATLQGSFPSGERIYSLTVPYPIAEDGAPASVTNLKATFEGASTTGKVTFKTPSITYAGELLEGDVEYYVASGSDIIAQGTKGPGEKVSVEVTGVEKKSNTYTVWTSNSVGAGPKKNVSAYVGLNTPSYSLTNISLTADKETGDLTLTWDELKGSHGGYIGDVTYNVLRNDEVEVATGLTDTEFTENLGGSTEMASYYYKIVAVCGEKKVNGKSNAVVLGDHVSLPYSTDFAAETDFNLFTVIDANEDKASWQYYNYNPKSAQYSASYNNTADDWLITPPAQVKGGKGYIVKFNVRESNAKYTNQLEVKYGAGSTAEAMTNAAFENAIEITAKEDTEHTFSVTPSEDMLLSVGFHAVSEKANGSIYISGISIEEDPTSGITEINANNAAKSAVYSIDGRMVRSSAASADGLKKGLYIINGKKVAVK